MKKYLVLAVVLLVAFGMRAQENYINYNLFDPDTCFTLQYPDTLYWDLNQDGVYDIYFYLESWSYGYLTYMDPLAQWKWSNSIRIDQNNWQPLTDTSMIDETLDWTSGYSFISGYETPEWWHFAFRHQAEDGLHFGWACIKPVGYLKFCISGMGYCLLPNQPIQWGQIELLSVEENSETNAFATLHPNPTTGIVIVKGESLRQAEVLNMLGQQVLSVQGKGNELHINMAALHVGVYFVNITDEEGRKCVHKVVKE